MEDAMHSLKLGDLKAGHKMNLTKVKGKFVVNCPCGYVSPKGELDWVEHLYRLHAGIVEKR